MNTRRAIDDRAASIAGLTIQRLVEIHPETMAVFAQHGLDMCCGGGHTVAEAARLHGLDADAVVTQVANAIPHDPS